MTLQEVWLVRGIQAQNIATNAALTQGMAQAARQTWAQQLHNRLEKL